MKFLTQAIQIESVRLLYVTVFYQPQYRRDFSATFDDMLVSVTRFLLKDIVDH